MTNLEELRMKNDFCNKLMETECNISKVRNGEMESKSANTIIAACNSVLSAIRTDEQEKKIQELQQLLDMVMEDKKR